MQQHQNSLKLAASRGVPVKKAPTRETPATERVAFGGKSESKLREILTSLTDKTNKKGEKHSGQKYREMQKRGI